MSMQMQGMVSDFLFIKRSIDICLPCCFCTLSSRAQPRCEVCVQIVCQIANVRGWFQHHDGAAVMG
jgi:hypothetical protein